MRITNIINKLFSGINKIFHLSKYAVITHIERVYLFLIGVQIKRGKFYGWCSFYYRNGSVIKIGKNASYPTLVQLFNAKNPLSGIESGRKKVHPIGHTLYK